MLPLILLVCAFVGSGIHLLVKNNWNREQIAEVFLGYLLFFSVGIMCLIGFYAHIFMTDHVAQMIGWTQGSPFQLEVGSANLAFGILGILCYFYRELFWLATGLGFSIFVLGALAVHLVEYAKGNNAPFNIGLFVWVNDLLVPVLIISLISYLFYFRKY